MRNVEIQIGSAVDVHLRFILDCQKRRTTASAVDCRGKMTTPIHVTA